MRLFLIMLLSLLSGCGGYENEKIRTDVAKENNPLLIPPCLKK
jgi:outer membrane lipoprotein-sorting protein